MRKNLRVLFAVLPLLLLALLVYICFPPPSEAELWLREQAQDADSLHVQYGSALPASIWKTIIITDDQEFAM